MSDKTHNVSEGGSYIVEKEGDKPKLVTRTEERAATPDASETGDTIPTAKSISSKPSTPAKE